VDIETYKQTFRENTKILLVFEVLEDRSWHCRNCEYNHVQTTQLAGGGGIQGLQKGSPSRPGIEILSQNNFCGNCNMRTPHDMWNGQFIAQTSSNALPYVLIQKILTYFNYKDIVENTTRAPSEITIDHKFPIIRWPESYGEKDKQIMNEIEIKERFQLLKKSNGSASHNMLKSRACESCVEKSQRGTPFGINFFYEGNEKWEKKKNDESGCYGCGWYDFDKWRKELNKFIKENSKAD